METVGRIISNFGTEESQMAYYQSIFDILKMARMKEGSIIEIAEKMELIQEEINSLEDCFQKFMNICQNGGYRPPHYWKYVFPLFE